MNGHGRDPDGPVRLPRGGRVVIAGVPEIEVERLHWNYGGGRGAVGLHHRPSGVTVARECPPDTPSWQLLQELEVELAAKLRNHGAPPAQDGDVSS